MVVAGSSKSTVHHGARILPDSSISHFVGDVKTVNIKKVVQNSKMGALYGIKLQGNHQVALVSHHPAHFRDIILRDDVDFVPFEIRISLVVNWIFCELEALEYE